MQANDYNTRIKPTFCPGCGHFGVWTTLKNVFTQMGWEKHQYVVVFDVGCGGNMADFLGGYGIHSLHGRVIPNGVGVKFGNHELPVVCIAGDGGTYGEANNHLVHAARANHDIKMIVDDNRIYGLTTGQTSPTSRHGTVSKSTPLGAIEYPVNALALAISQGATFVAQGFAGDLPGLTEIFLRAFKHKGFTLVNVLQPCVTWNKVDTYEYYRENTYKLEKTYGVAEKMEAMSVVMKEGKLPLGVIYEEERESYQELEQGLKEGILSKRPDYSEIVNEIMADFR